MPCHCGFGGMEALARSSARVQPHRAACMVVDSYFSV